MLKKNEVLNPGGLRNEKEFVNHKILDCIGDLYLSGYKVIASVKCSQGGHKLTNQLLRKVFLKPKKIFQYLKSTKNSSTYLINKQNLRNTA